MSGESLMIMGISGFFFDFQKKNTKNSVVIKKKCLTLHYSIYINHITGQPVI